jgi:PAS domain S-box-containing protein
MIDPPPADGIRLHETEAHFAALVADVRDYAIFLLSPGGIVRSWNAGAERFNGYRAEEIIGQPFTRFYPSDRIEEGWPQHELVVAAIEGRFEDEGWRLRKDGTRFWANIVLTALRDEAGGLRGYLKITRDVTDRVAADESLRQSEERFRLLVNGVEDYAIYMLDVEGRVVSWNAGAARLKGYEADEIIGRHFSTFYPSEAAATGIPQHNLSIALREGRFQEEGWRARKDRSLFWANVVLTALYDGAGKHIGFAKVTRDLTEQRKMVELEVADRQKNEFLAMLAHELRNPLVPIRNGLHLLKLEGSGGGSFEETTEMMERQVVHLVQMVDDLLEVSRIVGGRITLRRRSVSLSEVIQAAKEEAEPLMKARGHELTVTLPSDPIYVDGDVVRLAQALTNVLANAAKFTPKPSRIWLTAERERDDAVIRVRDEGIGIDPTALLQIFNVFVQENPSLDRSEGGLGLGLTLSKRLIELHGGAISAASAGKGQGSEFTIRLPLVDRANEQQSRDLKIDALRLRRRVLVVDDNVDAAITISALLKAWGHDVHTAYNGPDAINLANEVRPEIILLDIGLPGMSGYDVVRQLRTDPLHRGVRISALTGYGQAEDRRRSREAGFDYHMVKPPELSQLQEFVTSPETFLAT